jgi:alpha-D-xyloside xylohydrolase
MKQSNDFAHDMIDLDMYPNRILFLASRNVAIAEQPDGTVTLSIPFQPMRHNGTFMPIECDECVPTIFHLIAYGDNVIRLCGTFSDERAEMQDIMLHPDKTMEKQPLHLEMVGDGIHEVRDRNGRTRARLTTAPHKIHKWSDLQRAADPMLGLVLFPDGNISRPVRLMNYDHFFPGKLESVPLGYVADEGNITGTLFSIHASHNEHFYGTGERFGRLDLAGRTVTLENTDALGTASNKAYKNVPFYLSSAGYGLFIHSSTHMRLSFADISNRAVQGLIDDTNLDLFVMGGGTPERVIRNYRGLTGFSPELPLWSYGMWMSRMTYFSAKEVETITTRLRKEGYPCDVIHLDSGYFADNWVCDWKFSTERFPEPKKFIKQLKEQGFRISVWQTPNIGKKNPLYPEAVAHGYLPPLKEQEHMFAMSDFSGQDFGGQIDFTNEKATEWYKELLRGLLNLGVACIKTDFGEKILLHADFKHMTGERLHNIYCLLYQKAAFEATSEFYEKPCIWARSTWAGGQRYPLHWGGDTSATWDGIASTLRGGLQFGLSGYTFWSHDISGFHGLPEFMNSWPSENLYLRWTQFGVFTSHMRYHGTTPREPWHFPTVAPLVRSWLRLRYALIPYILQEAAYCIRTGAEEANGRSMMAPLLLDYPRDPNVWHIDDEYMFGRNFLVAPILNEEGTRNVYLPEGIWVDFFSGKVVEGNQWILVEHEPLACMPVFVIQGSSIPVYPLPVACTNEMVASEVRNLYIDSNFHGVASSILASLVSDLNTNTKGVNYD